MSWHVPLNFVTAARDARDARPAIWTTMLETSSVCRDLLSLWLVAVILVGGLEHFYFCLSLGERM